MDFIAATWASLILLILTWPALILLCCIALWTEWGESHGWTLFWTGVIHFWLFKYLELDLMTIVWYSLAYVPLGTAWSIYRWKRYVVSYIERKQQTATTVPTNYRTPELFNPDKIKQELKLTNNQGRIMSWVLIWPISVVERSLGDIAHQWWILISVRLGGIYNRITEGAINSVVTDMEQQNPKGLSTYEED